MTTKIQQYDHEQNDEINNLLLRLILLPKSPLHSYKKKKGLQNPSGTVTLPLFPRHKTLGVYGRTTQGNTYLPVTKPSPIRFESAEHENRPYIQALLQWEKRIKYLKNIYKVVDQNTLQTGQFNNSRGEKNK